MMRTTSLPDPPQPTTTTALPRTPTTGLPQTPLGLPRTPPDLPQTPPGLPPQTDLPPPDPQSPDLPRLLQLLPFQLLPFRLLPLRQFLLQLRPHRRAFHPQRRPLLLHPRKL
jgi:hypothetical protein